jgi:hypothetical protein
MRPLGFGCLGCGALLAFVGALAVAAAFIPGVVNSSETGTAVGIGGSVCAASFLPLLLGGILVAVGGRKATDT